MKGYHKLLKKSNKLYHLVSPVVLMLCCIAGLVTYVFLTESIKLETIRPSVIQLNENLSYPTIPRDITASISADAAIVMDNDTKTVIFSKNPRLRFSPASTTKLMSILVGMDYYKLNQLLEIKSDHVEGTVVGFTVGQKVTFNDLLYGMLLPSGNDAAIAVAQNYPGGESAFVAKMNQKAKTLGLISTHFGDPAGVTDDETYTRVNDLAFLASEFIKNPILADIVKTPYATITATDGSVFPVKSLNKLLGYYGVDGIKTGHTEGAGDVLVTSVTRGDHKYIIVVMRSDDRFADTVELIRKIVDNITYQQITL